ncbi:MAG: cupin domain-containing protein [Chloroflexi bacterium]|nr:cupin domain-containing protein [Chloroflexota bacterium]
MQKFNDCYITYNNDVDTLSFDWGKIRMLSEERVTGATSFSFGHVTLEPGKGHVRHNHPTADEVIYVVSGEGQQMLDDQAPVTVTAGACIWIPKGIYHSTINSGTAPMVLVVVYAPAGAEAVLREDPSVQIIPAGQ